MRRLLVLAAVTALAVARPETYREKEDFQYSRSSSDDGSKSGYYGAQRGNMGGNYERAHNMDTLAQHQMSGLVRQTQGELGDGATERSGSVFTAANSRGMYGSGHYDLGNLEGRNFQEGVSHDESQSHSSLSSQSAGYRGHSQSSYSHGGYGNSNAYNSRHRGYNSAGNSDQMLYANVQQHAADDLQAANQENRYESGYSAKSGYHSQSGYNQAHLDLADRYQSNAQHAHRLVGVSAIPVKVVLRPGTRVAVPVAAETYDASHGSTFDHNAINTEAESLSGNDQHVAYQPTSNGKHYESSYSYRKEWEKHNRYPASVPAVTPTINPYPQNSELYEDTQARNIEQEARGSESHNSHSSHRNYLKSASSQQSSHQADYNSQHHSSASNADSHAYTLQHNNGAALSQVLNNQVEDISSKPKSYQSSYSYHKSWERQGDPYVIKPVSTSDDASQRLTAASSNYGAHSDSHQYGSHYRYGSQRKTYLNNGDEDCDCDENGHVRVARSYNSIPDQQQEDLTQQTQQWDRLEDIGQQTQNKWDKYEDLGQQRQNLDLTQQSQNKWERIEDLGQATQNQWGNQQETVSHSNWDKLELEPQSQTDTDQQTQNKWSPFETMQNEHNKHDDQISTGFENTKPSNTFNVRFNSGTENTNSYNNFKLQKENKDASMLGQTFLDESQKQDKNTQDLEQQTQDKWNMFNSAFNKNYNEMKPTWHHSINSDQTSYSYNEPYFNYGQLNNAWMNNQEQFFNNKYNNAQNGYHYHWQTHSVSTPEQSWIEHTNSSLSSLWDKLDNIKKQSAVAQGTDEFKDNAANQHTGQTQTISDFEHTFQHHNYHNDYDKEEKHKVNTLLDDKQFSSVLTSTTTEKAKAFDILIDHEKLRPQDIGRGDIGPEDTITTTEETFSVKPLQSTAKPFKTPKEIDVLSLSKNSDKNWTTTQKTTTSTQINQHKIPNQNDYEGLGVLNLDKTRQGATHNFENSDNKFSTLSTVYTSTTPKSAFGQNTKQQSEDSGQQREHFFEQNAKFGEFGQQHENAETFGQRENEGVNFEQQSQNADAQFEQHFDSQHNGFYKESMNHKKSDAFNNQQHEQFEQELVPLQVEDLSQHNKRENGQQHTEQKNETEDYNKNLEQQIQNNNFAAGNFDQQVGNLEQENLEQQTQNFDQQTGNFEHENLEQQTQNLDQQTGNFEHDNLEQKTQNFDQQTGNFEHANLEQQTQNLDQQTGNFEHENLEQQTQNLDQQTGNFEHENLEQQTQNLDQQTGNFEHENLEQQTQNLDQQTGNFEHENLGQQTQSFDQQIGTFEHENLEQQTQNFDHPTGNFQHENLGQQPQNFDQQTGNYGHENLEQRAQSFDQQAGNFEHENLGQQTQNLDQQTGNFEHENLEQTQNFDQQSGNFEQHNLEQKPQNFEQQSQNFKHDNLEQQNQPAQIEESKLKPHEDLQKPEAGKFQHHVIPERIEQSNIDVEPPIISKKVAIVETPPEPVTEKVGFWKSVGSKFVNAKDKVSSWFSSS